jgi:hypothetical protein
MSYLDQNFDEPAPTWRLALLGLSALFIAAAAPVLSLVIEIAASAPCGVLCNEVGPMRLYKAIILIGCFAFATLLMISVVRQRASSVLLGITLIVVLVLLLPFAMLSSTLL